jgi:hypothetical protein
MCFSGEVLSAEGRIHVYRLAFRRITLMKATRWDDVLSGSERVSRRKSALRGSDESLFSLLLKIESRLRAGTKEESQLGPGRRKSSKLKGLRRSTPSNLSRYIE